MKQVKIYLLFLLVAACNTGTENEKQVQQAIDPEFVLIPGGEFTMGVKPDENQKFIHTYDHLVYVDSFYIDRYEVTNAQYHEFCMVTGHNLPEFWGMDEFRSSLNYPNHPVIGVNWSDAMAYANWKGCRLPTEAEWEYAARGELSGMKYPNGDLMDSTLGNYHTTHGHSLDVGSFPPNGYGLYDMSGNALEWVWDFYAKDYYLESPYKNPHGPQYGFRHCLRGGGWRSGMGCCTVYFRQSLRTYWVDFNVGFRCAKDI